ncbi:hypothetical protein GJ496_002155 [Pomphorhynchus laevis]|nr:hypothetical protein GJ496_002155 [Pomphorhynchus laevis]
MIREDVGGSCQLMFSSERVESELVETLNAIFSLILDMAEFASRTLEMVKLNNAVMERGNLDILKPKSASGNSISPVCSLRFNLNYDLKKIGETEKRVCMDSHMFIKRLQVERANFPDRFILVRVEFNEHRRALLCKIAFVRKLANIDAGKYNDKRQTVIIENLIKSLQATADTMDELLKSLNMYKPESRISRFAIRDTMRFGPIATSVLNLAFTSMNILCSLVEYAGIPVNIEQREKKRQCEDKKERDKEQKKPDPAEQYLKMLAEGSSDN